MIKQESKENQGRQIVMKKNNRLLAPVLCTMLAVSGPLSTMSLPVLAEEQATVTYSGNDGAHSFTKISHPDKGSGKNDGLVDYTGSGNVAAADQGQGDRGQSYSWAAQGYGDWVYVGTCYAAIGNTLTLMDSVLGNNFNKETMTAALNTLFRGTFFVGQENGDEDSNGILAKINVKTGETKILMSKNTTGLVPLFRNAITYHNKLYFCGSVNGLPSIYQIDPENDEINMVHQGMIPADMKEAYAQSICTGIRGMTEFNGQLIVSCVGKDGPYIMSGQEDADGSIRFTTIATNENLYKYAAYHYSDSIYGGSIWEIIPYNNHLYVALCTGTQDNRPDVDTMQSFAIVRGDQNADGRWSWTPVIGDQQKDNAPYTFGIDPQRTRAGACNLAVYNGYLYIGEYNDEEIALEDVLFDTDFTFMAKNLEQSVNLYRMDPGENIELVVGDPTNMFPTGGLSNLGSGFGRHENQYIWQMTVHNNKLYVGTFDTSSLLYPVGQISTGDLFRMSKEEWKLQLDYARQFIALLIRDLTSSTFAAVDSDGLSSNGLESLNLTPEQQEEYSASCKLLETMPMSISEEDAQLESFCFDSWLDTSASLWQTPKQLLDLNIDLVKLYGQWIESSNGQDSIDEGFNRHSAFIEKYKELYERYQELRQKLPEEVQEYYDKILNSEMVKKFSSMLEVMKYTRTAERGFDLYTTADGVNFQSVTTNGFNDPYNHGLRVFAKTADNQLAIGTANPFYGTQIWKLDQRVNENPGGNASGNTGSSSSSTLSANVDLHRLYNPNSGEHFYTQDLKEKNHLVSLGWKYEGIGWTSPAKKSTNLPVYRLYNPNAGDHHYTKDLNESKVLQSLGWKDEGIGWYSLPDNKGVPVYRQYNPNAKQAGSHNYTKDKGENDYLASVGWSAEGIAWWAVK